MLRTLFATSLLVLLQTMPLPSLAASGGLTVELKANESAGAGSAGEYRLYGASYALVIGIDDYRAGWPRLSNAAKDAELVAAALVKRGFDVTLALNLDSDALEEALETFFIVKGADPDSRLFVWFAGHGHTERREGYLIATDVPLPQASEIQFRRKALSLRRFGEYVREAQSKHIFSIFDSCFAGTIFDSARSAPPPAITQATARPVRQFLSSGEEDQQVSDDGTFRRIFLEALDNERRSDANGDGYLTASELGIFLTSAVSNYSQNRQTPRYGKLRDPAFDRGDFVFKLPGGARATAGGQTAALPPAGGATAEILFWQSIQDSGEKAEFEAYLEQFPEGTFVPLAKSRIRSLEAADQKTRAAREVRVKAFDGFFIADKTANLRAGPGTSYDKVGRLSQGQVVAVTGQVEGQPWYRVTDSDGGSAYIHASLLRSMEREVAVAEAEPTPSVAEPAPPEPVAQTAPAAETRGSGQEDLTALQQNIQELSALLQENKQQVAAVDPKQQLPLDRFDGEWEVDVSFTQECRGGRVNEMEIESGTIKTSFHHPNSGRVRMAGTVDAEGNIHVTGTTRGVNVTLTGTLEEGRGGGKAEIDGRANCASKWTARR